MWADSGAEQTRTRHPLLLESASLPDKGRQTIFWGVEFEEDSGDFPTTKFPLHFYWAPSDRMLVGLAAEMVIFNHQNQTSAAATNSAVSFLYQLAHAARKLPAVTVRQDLLCPTGGFSTGRWNGVSSLLLTWQGSRWRFHANTSYALGSHDSRPTPVSEVDRWRALLGVELRPTSGKWALLAGFVAAKPIRPKKFEPSLEGGVRRMLGKGWNANVGAGKRTRAHHGPEYILRVTVGRSF